MHRTTRWGHWRLVRLFRLTRQLLMHRSRYGGLTHLAHPAWWRVLVDLFIIVLFWHCWFLRSWRWGRRRRRWSTRGLAAVSVRIIFLVIVCGGHGCVRRERRGSTPGSIHGLPGRWRGHASKSIHRLARRRRRHGSGGIHGFSGWRWWSTSRYINGLSRWWLLWRGRRNRTRDSYGHRRRSRYGRTRQSGIIVALVPRMCFQGILVGSSGSNVRIIISLILSLTFHVIPRANAR